MARLLLAYINEAHVGTLSAENNLWVFEYTETWATAKEGYDLSPALPRANDKGEPTRIEDGGTARPVQWYFDNLLPEEGLRVILAKEAKVLPEDAFGLLEYYGRESAGSLTLLREGESPSEGEKRPLPLDELSARIKKMPTVALNNASPKKMSLAGAQHKLAVIYRDGELYEPDGQAASTHIIKPEHSRVSEYPSSVVNEYLTMRVAYEVGLNVPRVQRIFCPEPVYLIERFDRKVRADGSVERLHAIDACQMLNIDRIFKYSKASIASLASLVDYLKVPGLGKQWFYDWLVFNILMGNGDNHLKNISFMISHDGVRISPCYDLLSTGAYKIHLLNEEDDVWPATEFPIIFSVKPQNFSDITRQDIIEAGITLGLHKDGAVRRLDSLIDKIPKAVEKIKEEVKLENSNLPEHVREELKGDIRMMNIIKLHIVDSMVKQLQG